MKNKYIVVDVESDGPIIGEHSMICFGAVLLNEKLDTTFYGQVKPISENYIPEVLKISGFSREEHLKFDDSLVVIAKFADWLKSLNISSPVLLSDNNGYDASWINYYFLKYYGENPFGWSSRRIGDLFCGYYKNLYYPWKKHRNYKFGFEHNHNPLTDAKANAAALLYLINQGFKI